MSTTQIKKSASFQELRLSKAWLIIVAIGLWWNLGLFTVGLFILWSIMYYRRYKIELHKDKIVINTGAFIRQKKTILNRNIATVNFLLGFATVITNDGRQHPLGWPLNKEDVASLKKYIEKVLG